MAIRKNKKRIDPRYFLHETTYRDLDEQGEPSPVFDQISQAINNKDAQTATQMLSGILDDANQGDGNAQRMILQLRKSFLPNLKADFEGSVRALVQLTQG
tara:strand:+ start:250 stop:549 length:300 start_codon:yes stop_codon:yes gene_type:complete